jgi:hypothetical protein
LLEVVRVPLCDGGLVRSRVIARATATIESLTSSISGVLYLFHVRDAKPCCAARRSFAGCPQADVRARGEQRMAMLRELAEIGMRLARGVERQAQEPQEERRAGDLGLVFSRIARAVRQTLALEAKLDEDRRARHEKAEAERAQARRVRGFMRKIRAGDIAERVLANETDGEALVESLGERLQDIDDTDFADRPMGEIVAAICRDLGVEPDWSLWQDEPWAAEALAAEAPGPPPTPFLSREAGEGDRSPQSERWRGQASSPELNSS